MPNNLGAALAGGFQGYQQYQNDKQKRELEAIDLMTRQQQLRLEQQKADATAAAALRANKADENAAGVLQGFYAGTNGQGATPPQVQGQQMPPQGQPQQTAMGQPSVPMQQPGQRPPMPPQQGQQPPPLPPGGVQGQMPPPGTPPLPPGMPGGQGQQRPAPPPPYQRIGSQPQAGQGQPAPQQQPAAQVSQQPPAEGSLTFQGAVKMLQSKGVQGPALVDALDRIKPYLDDQAKQEAQAVKTQLAIQTSINQGLKLQLQGKHEDAQESYQQAELALRGLQISATQASTAATTDLKKAEIEHMGIPSGYERKPDGSIGPMKGGPADPTGPNFKAPKGATGRNAPGATIADAMNPTMLASVRYDIKEGRNALDGMRSLTTNTAGPTFGHDSGIVGSIFGRGLTTDQQQQYETYANRIAQALASTQSMGRGQISDAKVREAQKLVPQIGDTKGNVDLKLKQLQKLFDMANETLSSPIKGNPAEPDQDRESATAGSVPGGGNQAPKTVHWDDLK